MCVNVLCSLLNNSHSVFCKNPVGYFLLNINSFGSSSDLALCPDLIPKLSRVSIQYSFFIENPCVYPDINSCCVDCFVRIRRELSVGFIDPLTPKEIPGGFVVLCIPTFESPLD